MPNIIINIHRSDGRHELFVSLILRYILYAAHRTSNNIPTPNILKRQDTL